MRALSLKLILCLALVAGLSGCGKDSAKPNTPTIVLKSNAPSFVSVGSSGSLVGQDPGNFSGLNQGDSAVYTGDVGVPFQAEFELRSFAKPMYESVRLTFKPGRQVAVFNIDSTFYYLRIVNNSDTNYDYALSSHVLDELDFHYPIESHHTTELIYFYSGAGVQISIGRSSDPNDLVFTEGVDFVLPNTKNQIVTLVIN